MLILLALGLTGAFVEGFLSADSDATADRDAPTTQPTGKATGRPDPNPTGAAPEPTATPTEPTEPTEPAEQPVELAGDGEANTDPFTLTGGDYRTTVTVTGDCHYGMAMKDPAGNGATVDITAPGDPGEASDRLYNVDGGEWYLQVITGPPPGCPWTLTLAPID